MSLHFWGNFGGDAATEEFFGTIFPLGLYVTHTITITYEPKVVKPLRELSDIVPYRGGTNRKAPILQRAFP